MLLWDHHFTASKMVNSTYKTEQYTCFFGNVAITKAYENVIEFTVPHMH